jgi:hypothetical protein
VGSGGLLAHNGPGPDPCHLGSAMDAAKGTAAVPEKPVVKAPEAGKAPEPSKAGGVTPEKVEPASATLKPTTEKSNVPWTVTEDSAPAFHRKPQLPQGGTWKNADGSPGVPGESFWHGPDPSVPPIKFEKQFPVYEPVYGVEIEIPMVGRIDPNLDFRRASKELGERLKTGTVLRQQFGIDEQFVNQNLLFSDGKVNMSAVEAWLESKHLIWHHHQNMQTMQLLDTRIHGPKGGPAFHQGGESYAASTIEGLIARNVITEAEKRNGLTPELIERAKELGIIPNDFPW